MIDWEWGGWDAGYRRGTAETRRDLCRQELLYLVSLLRRVEWEQRYDEYPSAVPELIKTRMREIWRRR